MKTGECSPQIRVSKQAELRGIKAELQTALKSASDADKLVANLEGQLAVYKSLDVSAKNDDADGTTTE